MFFDRLDPADVDPALLVERADDRRWLDALLRGHLALEGPPAPRVVCLSGPPGVGKSILARAALDDLAADFPLALRVTVDCAACRGPRGVLAALVGELGRALDRLQRASAHPAAPALLAGAQALRTLSRFEDVPLRVVHEQLRPFWPALDRAATPELFQALRLAFGLAFDLTDKQIKRLTGVARFDEAGLVEATSALLADVRAAGLGAVVLLDDLDELRPHGAGRAPDRAALEAVLGLRHAPVGWVLPLRTAATAAIPRDVSNIRALRPLGAAHHQAVLAARLRHERAALRDRLQAPELAPVVERLARMAPTPRAFLRWVKFLFEEGRLSAEGLADGFDFFLESDYSALDADVLRAVAWSFPSPEGPATEDALVAALAGGDPFTLEQLVDRRVVRASDDWSPATTYRLDPELAFLHPVAWGKGETP